MLILHDDGKGDPRHVLAFGSRDEGLKLFDYVRVQGGGRSWAGQIVSPNINYPRNGQQRDPVTLHGLLLLQTGGAGQAGESVHVWDILLLGQYAERGQLDMLRERPVPGDVVTKLDAEATLSFLEFPPVRKHADGTTNVIGRLLNADGVPLTIRRLHFPYHINVCGATGAAKSNVNANLVHQWTQYGGCALVHDAKPDYPCIGQANTDRAVAHVWPHFEPYGLWPRGAADVIRIGIFGTCDQTAVDRVVGFRASDFSAAMLAAMFFPPNDINGFEAFCSVATALREARTHYSLEDIKAEVRRRAGLEGAGSNGTKGRMPAGVADQDVIHEATALSILRKVGREQPGLPWMDALHQDLGLTGGDPFVPSRRVAAGGQGVQAFDVETLVKPGRLLVIDYSQVDPKSYALLLSYFLAECQSYRIRQQPLPFDQRGPGLLQCIDEAQRLFDNQSRHAELLESTLARVMREARTSDHCFLLSLQSASQIPHNVRNNLNTTIVMRQNSKYEAQAATESMGKEFGEQATSLARGQALVKLNETCAVVLAQMAPSPYELLRTDTVEPPAVEPSARAAEEAVDGGVS